jgi:stage II sporulation protein Q
MNENNQQNQDKASKSTVEAATVKSSRWKRLLAKKWVFPATYVAAAAIILTLMWVIQDSGSSKVSDESTQAGTIEQTTTDTSETPDALPVTANLETMAWPVENKDEVVVAMPFYDPNATNEDKQAAMIEHDDTFIPNTGISLARQDNQSFNVVAALSGTVSRVEKVPLIGNLVEITHENGLKTVYQSVSEVAVAKGAQVKQGDLIAKSGRNELEKDLGVHLHFEVIENGQPTNPAEILTKTK